MLAQTDKLHCIRCGVRAEPKCSCGARCDYIPAGQAAALAIAAHPDWSDRQLAEAVGVGVMTISRARPTGGTTTISPIISDIYPGVPNGTPDETGGRVSPNGEPEEPAQSDSSNEQPETGDPGASNVPPDSKLDPNPAPAIPEKRLGKDGKRYPAKKQARDKTDKSATGKPPKEPKTVVDILRAYFMDGKWHRLEDIAARANIDAKDMCGKLDRQARPSYVSQTGAKIERKKVGTSFEYRFFPLDKTVSLKELIEKLTPIIKKLEEQGRAGLARMVPFTVAQQATALKKLLEEWGK